MQTGLGQRIEALFQQIYIWNKQHGLLNDRKSGEESLWGQRVEAEHIIGRSELFDMNCHVHSYLLTVFIPPNCEFCPDLPPSAIETVLGLPLIVSPG